MLMSHVFIGKNVYVYGWMDEHTNRQANRQINRYIDRQVYR